MEPEDERSPYEDYELVTDALNEILNQYDYPPPERVPERVESFDAIVRAVLGIADEDALPLIFDDSPADWAERAAGRRARAVMEPVAPRSASEDYRLIMDAVNQILNEYPKPPPERVPRYLKRFDVSVRSVLGIPNEEALPLLFDPTPASPDPATAGQRAE